MTPFDHALTHVLNVLARADAGKIGRASQESLGRLIELTRQHTPSPASASRSPQPAHAPQRSAAASHSSPPPPAAQEKTTPAAPASEGSLSTETAPPRRKLGLAEQLKAAMASGNKPPQPAAEPETTPPPPSPSPAKHEAQPARTSTPPPADHLPPELQLEQLNESILAGSSDPRALVLGEGSARAELVFVGAAPAPGETAPIAGEVGALFDKIIATMRLRKGDLYITNVLKHPAAEARPSPEEVEAALPSLLSEIGIIRPKCIVALGETALATLVGKTDSIHDVRGEWHSFRGIPVMATFHPGYLCENESKQVRRMFWEDMLQVLELLAKPITPRQREFFK